MKSFGSWLAGGLGNKRFLELGGAERKAAPDGGRRTAFRGSMALQQPRQVSQAVRRDRAMLQNTIERLSKYPFMADFGACTVSWPLPEQHEKDILAGKLPEL